MGAFVFFIMFLALIPVAAFLLEVLHRLGIVTDLKDPAEWDMPESSEEAAVVPQIVLLPQTGKKKAM